jgi:SAM-dependent methyltransferase
MLPFVIEREHLGPVRVLEMAPKACFTDFCKRRPGWSYVSGDLSSPTAMVRCDLRKMPFANDSFDLIVVFHVMEHIIEDAPAFREIARMLDQDGLGLICVPVRGEMTQEGAPESEWERVYGQADHVRIYGMDIEARMRTAGLSVQCVDVQQYFSAAQLDRHGLRGDDRYLFFVRKASAA